MRGGSWNNNPNNLRVADRNYNDPQNTNNNVGFRCAQDIHLYVGARHFVENASPL